MVIWLLELLRIQLQDMLLRTDDTLRDDLDGIAMDFQSNKRLIKSWELNIKMITNELVSKNTTMSVEVS